MTFGERRAQKMLGEDDAMQCWGVFTISSVFPEVIPTQSQEAGLDPRGHLVYSSKLKILVCFIYEELEAQELRRSA